MSRAARTSLIALLALAAVASGCRRARPAGPRRTYVHPNGLTLAAPETIHSAVAGMPDASAGSGGPEHELRARESARGGHVAYVQRVQSEGEADFGLIWAIIEGTKPPS
jgi:hypothetical protein